MQVLLDSRAKLNLNLCVLNLRPDKFHNIQTTYERIDLCDKVKLILRADTLIKVSSNLSSLPKGPLNLAYRAAALLQQTYGVKKGASIRITKRIPVASGMGGGSSNAATVLLGLNKLWGLSLSRRKLALLAKKIGSDVPFFIYDTPFAQGLEKGDKIQPLRRLAHLRLWHILAVPRIKVSTPVIYKRWDSAQNLEKAGLTRGDYNVKLLRNDLEPITCSLYPEVARVKEVFKQLGVKKVSMSGSGAAVFGLVSSRKEAVNLYRQLRKRNKSWQIFVVRTI